LVVDRMLPKRDGLSVIGSLRDKGNRTPVLIPRARAGRRPQIKGLARRRRRLSAETLFLCRLLARSGAVAPANVGPAEETTYRVGDLELDRLSHRWPRQGAN